MNEFLSSHLSTEEGIKKNRKQPKSSLLKYVTYGETLIRLSSPHDERILQKPRFDAYIGGAETNVAVSLANWGCHVNHITNIPDNPLSDCIKRFLRSHGVGTSRILCSGNRIGTYYTENGADQRPSSVIYDRYGSSFSTAKKDDMDWPTLLEGAGWLHFTGISPALSQRAADNTLDALICAKELGLTISCDLNYRSSLWNYGISPIKVMPNLFEYVDVAIANEFDCKYCLDIDLTSLSQKCNELERFGLYSHALAEAYPNLKIHAATNRQVRSASSNDWTAYLRHGSKTYSSRVYQMNHIIDRIGSGDSFAAGLLYGLTSIPGEQEAIEFAAAAGCLKHSISGDCSLTSLVEVISLAEGTADGRIRR